MWFEASVVAGACFVAAFCAGMAGFAFVLVAAGILLHVVPPSVTAPVLVLGSLMAQSMALPPLWKHIEWPRLRAFLGVALLAWRLGVNSVLTFWVAYILTRPFGASLGDLLTQAKTYGGLGMGANWTSALFLCVIVLLVAVAQLNVGNRKAITQ